MPKYVLTVTQADAAMLESGLGEAMFIHLSAGPWLQIAGLDAITDDEAKLAFSERPAGSG